MEAARNNVTEISQYSRERKGGGGRMPLDDCREISALGLKHALDDGLEQVKLKLLQMVEKAMGMELYHLYMDTLELVRDHSVEIGTSFRKHYLQRFNQECRRDKGRIRKETNVSELSLLAPDDLEESLASGTLANAIHNACSEELFSLDKRMGMLVNDPDLSQGDNPLGPEVIADALMDALSDQDAPMKARLLTVAQLSKHLPARVKDIYSDINRLLVKKNVLPTIRVGLRRSAPATVGSAMQPAMRGDSQGGGEVFAMLQHLMGMGGSPVGVPIAGPAMPGEAVAAGGFASGGGASIAPEAFIQALGLLQRGRIDEAVQAGLDAAALSAIAQGNGQVNVLHGLRTSRMAGAMASVDAMTLDIVAMVFDYILEDKRIPDAIKALISRLQIPVLKVAMLDKAFFSQKSHPARRLLDALAEAAIGWDAAEGHESGLYRKIDQLVEDILHRFEDRIEVFDEALVQLNAFLTEERQAAAAAMASSVHAVKTREQVETSRQIAHDEVQSCLLGHTVSAAIRAFLTGHWQRMLADIHQKAGEDSPAWRGALDTMADLVWSLTPKTHPDERRKLVGMLPGLLKRLDEGVRYLGITQPERDAFFTSLVKCHAEAVRAGMLDEGEELLAMVAVSESMGIPTLSSPADFEPVEPVEAPLDQAPLLVQELTADADEATIEEITIGDLQWSSAAPEARDAESELGRLKRGSWIEYQQDDGAEVRAKLSWISPLKGMYLFTNRLGQRAICINADGLLAKLRNGEVRILNDAPLMDRAVGSLVERLQRQAA